MQSRNTRPIVGLTWSLVLGLGLTLLLVWAMVPRSAASAQVMRPELELAPVVESPEPAEPDRPDPTPEGASSPGMSAIPNGGMFRPVNSMPSMGLPSVANSGITAPPLPGSADLVISLTSDRVWGVVGPRQTVTVTRGGTQVGADLADDIGFFWTTLYEGGYQVDLTGGETVAVYVDGGMEASLTLPVISGEIDLVSDIVSGTVSGPTHPVSVTVYAPSANYEPSMTSYSQTVSTELDGSFQVDMSGIWDFAVVHGAVVAVTDGGVEVHQRVYSGASMLARPWPLGAVMGRAAPAQTVTVTLQLSDTTVKDSAQLTADETGWYRWDAGGIFTLDIVVVELDDGTVMSRTIDPLTVSVDVENDRLTGEALDGAVVRGISSHLTPLGWQDVQTSAVASGGVYTLEFGAIADLLPDTWGGVFVADAEGDELNLWAPSMSVFVNQTYNEVYGRAPSPPGPIAEGHPVSLTLYSAESESTSVYTKGMEWYGWYNFNQEEDGLLDIRPGDVVTVESEGFGWQGVVQVMTMTVQTDLDADQVSGTVETPGERVEIDGWIYQEYELFPIGGSFATVAGGPGYSADLVGFDLNYNQEIQVSHRTADDYVERISHVEDGFGIIMPANAVLVSFSPPGTPFTITLRAGDGAFKAEMTGVSMEPTGFGGWYQFWETGERIERGDMVQVQSATGFDEMVIVPDITVYGDLNADVLFGQGPPNVQLYANISWNDQYQSHGFISTDADGQYSVFVDELQSTWGDGDLTWGRDGGINYVDENRTWIFYGLEWPQIVASYDMEGGSAVWGQSLPGSTVVITVTESDYTEILTVEVATGDCEHCGPNEYYLELPDHTIAPDNIVIADFGAPGIDETVVVAVTGYPDIENDIVTGTAPAEVWLHANADCYNGGCGIDMETQVDASGVYTLNLGDQGFDIQYGDRFNIDISDEHNHQTHYHFWIPFPELGVWKGNTNAYARPGGVVVYQIDYSNDGDGTAENTLITDTLPLSTSYAGDTSGLPVSFGAGDVITWDLSALEAWEGGRFMVTLDLLGGLSHGDQIEENRVAISTSSPGDPYWDNNTSEAGWVDVWDDGVEVGIEKWPDISDPAPGQEFGYTLRWCNNRGAAAGPVVLTDTLPMSVTLLYWSEGDDQHFWNAVSVTDEQLVLVAPGLPGDVCQDVYLRLRLDEDVPEGTTLINQASIYVEGDEYWENNTVEDSNAVAGPPRYDAYLEKNAHSFVPVPGGWVNYFLWYRNDSNVPIAVTVTDTLQAGLSYVGAWWGGGQPQQDDPFPEPIIDGNDLIWSLGELGVGEAAWFHIQVDISDTFSPTDVIVNCATIGVDGDETTPENNTSCIPITLNEPGANLSVFKDGWWNGDGQLGYQVEFANIGTERVYNVLITDTLPELTNWNGWWNLDTAFGQDRQIDQYDAGGGELVWEFEYLDPGDRGWIEFNADLVYPGERMMWYTNTVMITEPDGDINPADNVWEDVQFSRGEVDRVELWMNMDGGSNMWGDAQPGWVTVTTPHTQVVVWAGQPGCDTCWNVEDSDQLDPGDWVLVEAGAGLMPVFLTVADPFDVEADSDADRVYGQVGGWNELPLEVHGGWPDGYREVNTDETGAFEAVYDDLPRGSNGYVRFVDEVNYAEVIYHREFMALDLILQVNYGHDWVQGFYAPDHTVWITVTESGGTEKATLEVMTAYMPDWGQPGFRDEWGEWDPERPDIEPGDWVLAAVDDGETTELQIGTISGTVDVENDSISGQVDAWWLPQTEPLDIDCHPWGAPEWAPNPENKQDSVLPDGLDTYTCGWDPVNEWDVEPWQDIGVQYIQPDRNSVFNVFWAPAPYLSIQKQANGEPAAGGNMEFTIQIWNNGDATAENVVITDTLQGMSYLSDTSDGTLTGPVALPGGEYVVWDIGSMPPYSYREFQLYAQVDMGEGGEVTNTVQVATSSLYDQGEPWEKLYEWSRQVSGDNASLSIGKNAWTDDPTPGQFFVWNVSICNNGGTSSAAVTITDTLPPSTTLQTWWSQNGGWEEVSVSDQQLVVSRPTIPNGWCDNVRLLVQLDEDAPLDTWINNTAELESSSPLENSWAEYWVYISEPHTNLNINKDWNWGYLVPGGELHYSINFNNSGNLPATDVLITDTLPVSTSFQSAWHHDQYNSYPYTPTLVTDEYVVWSVDVITNGFGGDFEVVLDVDPDAEPGTWLVNTAEISPQPNEDDYEDNLSSWTEMLYGPGPNLRVRKDGGWHGHGEGHDAWYHLVIENVGDEGLEHVTITDTYPLSMALNGTPWDGWDLEDVTDNGAEHWFSLTFHEMGPGHRQDFNFDTVIPDPGPVPGGLVMTNTVEIMAHPDETTWDDNLSEYVLTTGPDLWVKKKLVEGQLLPGELITFVLVYGNDRPNWQYWWNLQGEAWVADTLPPGLLYMGASSPPTTLPGGRLGWSVGSLQAGEWGEIYLMVQIDPDATGLDHFTNEVEIYSTEPDLDVEVDYGNNSDSYEVLVDLPFFEVSKVYQSSEIAGTDVVYTLTVTNLGYGLGTEVILSDTVPAGLIYGGEDPMTWLFESIDPEGGTAEGSFQATLPCSLVTITNDDYRVVSSAEGVDSEPGAPVALNVIAPTVSAGLDSDPASAVVGSTFTFTDASSTDGTPIVAWKWEFDDGSAAVYTEDASHVYLTDGEFEVTHTVTDSCGYADTETVLVTVDPPDLVAGALYDPASAVVGSTFTFTDASSTDGPPIEAWKWEFDDGSGPVYTQDASHVYLTDGEFEVTHTVTDSYGYADAVTVLVTVDPPALVADFQYDPDPANILTDDTVTFTDTSTTDGPEIVAWAWSFGDGGTADTQDTDHTYTQTGVYTVSLVVTDALGYSDDLVMPSIVVVSPRCIPLTGVSLAHAPDEPVIHDTVLFTATVAPVGATMPITYVWDMQGITSTTTVPVTQYAFPAHGDMTVKVTAYNACTLAGVTTQEVITVHPIRVYLPLVMRN